MGAVELVELLHEAELAGAKGNVADMVGRVEQAALGLDALLREIQDTLARPAIIAP